MKTPDKPLSVHEMLKAYGKRATRYDYDKDYNKNLKSKPKKPKRGILALKELEELKKQLNLLKSKK